MPTTKYKIAEQVLYAISGGIPDSSSNVQIEDIMEAVGQLINTMLKATFYENISGEGDTIPETYILAIFENISVKSWGCNRSIAELPAIPIALPKNMGIYQVSDKEDFSNPFIPMANGQYALMLKQPILSSLLNQVSYEVQGNKLAFSEDITQLGIDKIFIQEILFDINKLDDYAPLPIPADYESTIVQNLIKMFAPVPNGDNYSDNNTQLNQSIPNQ